MKFGNRICLAPCSLLAVLLLAATSEAAPAPVRPPPVAMRIAAGPDPTQAEFFIAKSEGYFARNGLDVTVTLGTSGSAMVPLLMGNQVNAAVGNEQGGISAHARDPQVVAVAEIVESSHNFALVARNVASIDCLKGKRIGVDPSSGSQLFWLMLVKHLPLNVADYRVVPVAMPEMVAALERGDIDAFCGFQPWTARALQAIPNTRNLRDNAGIFSLRDLVYMNRGWIASHGPATVAFIRSLMQARDYINGNRADAVQKVSAYLRIPPELTDLVIRDATYVVRLPADLHPHLQEVEAVLRATGRLQAPLDWTTFYYTAALTAAAPAAMTLVLPPR
jgi:NitT/TauT family transport system substrate-binding protein